MCALVVLGHLSGYKKGIIHPSEAGPAVMSIPGILDAGLGAIICACMLACDRRTCLQSGVRWMALADRARGAGQSRADSQSASTLRAPAYGW
jgi:hypothetical protein